MIAYHDDEWGVPLHDDRALFEFLILEGAQAGLSWSTILRKRDELPQGVRPLRPAQDRALRRRQSGARCWQTRASSAIG